ncbi:MAG TPA: ComF family protein [Acidobacteriota bacterium]|nr:ComF family protein [Acidobacteriota bacterium]
MGFRIQHPGTLRLHNHAVGTWLSIRDAFFSLLFPRDCPGCTQRLAYPEVICASCEAALKRILAPFCSKCGAPMPAHWKVKTCPVCKTRKSPLSRVRSVCTYDDLIKRMIRDVKYSQKTRYTRFFAELLFPILKLQFPASVEAIVPVPLHRKRQWERRYNQTELIAKELAQLTGLPVCHLLVKSKITKPQSSLSGLARWRNLKDSFDCVETNPVPRSIVLLDDVITTGATLQACAIALRRAGVRRVYALTVARSVKRF